MFEWKVVLVNGKEYIIKSDKNLIVDIIKELFGSNGNNQVLSSWDLSDIDKNNSKSVIINSKTISSIEYNFCRI